MDDACDSNMPSSSRNFGHCIVSWEIQNYGRALWQKNLEIKTPQFSIKRPNSKDTKWKLILETESNHNSLVEDLNVKVNFKENENIFAASEELSETDFKSSLGEDEKEKLDVGSLNENRNSNCMLYVKNPMIYLERGSDEGPDKVCVDWKVSYIGIKGEKVSLVHDEHFFYRKTKYGFNIGTLYDFERDFEYNSGLMTILCDIIVTDTGSLETFNDEMSIDLYGLSEDLKWIFDQQKFCDSEIKVDGKSVKAHKAILCSNGDFFTGSTKHSNVFELSYKYNEVLKVLEYMYSHDLKDVIGKPSLSIYDAAIEMNLRDLSDHYAPEKVSISTKLDVTKLTHQWIISDFSKKTDCISSSILKNNHDDAAWQIHLYPNGIDGKSVYVGLTVECIDGVITNDLCIQCAVLTNNENLNHWKNLQKAEDNTIARDVKFLLREDVLKLLNNDTLRLGFKVRTSLGNKSTIVNEPCTPVLYSMKKSFENMVRNMTNLRKNNKYTDVTFYFGKKEVKAHKFILSARSHLFCKKFEETISGIPVLHIHPETFEIILDYIYCATLDVSDINTIINVYKSAAELLIPRLQEKCARLLQNSLRVDNMLKIFALANEHCDKYLKETAEKFIECNKNELKLQGLKNQKLETSETKAVPNDNDIVSAECITKKISVVKYKSISIVEYDFELAARHLKGNFSHTKQNGESTLITAMKTVSNEVSSECLEDLHSNEKNKSLAETQKQIIYIADFDESAQSNKLSTFSIKHGNKIDFSDNEEIKANEQLKDNEMIYVYIDSKGNEIKENPSSSKTAVRKVIRLPTGDKEESQKILDGLNSSLKDFIEIKKEIDADMAKEKDDENRKLTSDEQSESNLKSNLGPNESQKDDSKLDSTLNEPCRNGQESSDEQNRSNLKPNVISECESPKKSPKKADTALSELHKNAECLDEQNESNLKSI